MNEQAKPLISVIMPVYNAENVVSESIESVIAQRFSAWELIIVDDGSTDKSGKICDDLAARDARIKVFHVENGGVSNARNYGLQHAKGIYIQFLDADDLVMPDTLQIAYENSRDFDLVIWSYERFPVKGIQKTEKTYECFSFNEITECFPVLLSQNLFNVPWNKLFKRNKIVENGLHFQVGMQVGEDQLFNLAYISTCRSMKILPDILSKYRCGVQETLSAKFYPDLMETQQMLKEKADQIFQGNKTIIAVTREKYLGYVSHYIQTCACSNKLTRVQKIALIKKILNDEYMVNNRKLGDPDTLHKSRLVRILIIGKCATLLYWLCVLRRRKKK